MITGLTSWTSAIAAAEAAIEAIARLCDELRIPRTLSELGVAGEQLPALVHSSRGNSMDGNPRDVSDEELHAILEQMLPAEK